MTSFFIRLNFSLFSQYNSNTIYDIFITILSISFTPFVRMKVKGQWKTANIQIVLQPLPVRTINVNLQNLKR